MTNNDEAEFQRTCTKFIDREVYCCITEEANYIINKGFEDNEVPFSYNDIDYTPTEEEIKDIVEELKETSTMYEDYTEEDLRDEAITEARNRLEIYEYYKVSGWLIKKLAEKGVPVIRDSNVWCRTTTGQSIILDGCIRDIVRDLG